MLHEKDQSISCFILYSRKSDANLLFSMSSSFIFILCSLWNHSSTFLSYFFLLLLFLFHICFSLSVCWWYEYCVGLLLFNISFMPSNYPHIWNYEHAHANSIIIHIYVQTTLTPRIAKILVASLCYYLQVE